MSALDRLRTEASEQRKPEPKTPTPTALASLAARLMEPEAQSDLTAWRTYRDEPDAFRRMRLRIEHGDAIDRGRDLDDELPPSAAPTK